MGAGVLNKLTDERVMGAETVTLCTVQPPAVLMVTRCLDTVSQRIARLAIYVYCVRV